MIVVGVSVFTLSFIETRPASQRRSPHSSSRDQSSQCVVQDILFRRLERRKQSLIEVFESVEIGVTSTPDEIRDCEGSAPQWHEKVTQTCHMRIAGLAQLMYRTDL
jgi:hypothetical protein